jgi:hypothetical protein
MAVGVDVGCVGFHALAQAPTVAGVTDGVHVNLKPLLALVDAADALVFVVAPVAVPSAGVGNHQVDCGAFPCVDAAGGRAQGDGAFLSEEAVDREDWLVHENVHAGVGASIGGFLFSSTGRRSAESLGNPSRSLDENPISSVCDGFGEKGLGGGGMQYMKLLACELRIPGHAEVVANGFAAGCCVPTAPTPTGENRLLELACCCEFQLKVLVPVLGACGGCTSGNHPLLPVAGLAVLAELEAAGRKLPQVVVEAAVELAPVTEPEPKIVLGAAGENGDALAPVED